MKTISTENRLSLPYLADLGTLPNRVYLIMEEAILQGKIKPGERLIEEELARALGVSRAPIREAMRMMQRDGLIVAVPRKGTFVNSISREDIEEIYEVAGVLEGLAVRLFCQRATDDELAELRDIYEQMEGQSRSEDLATYRKLNRDFHEYLIKGSRNKKIKEIYSMFQKQISWFQNVNLSLPGNREISLREHKKILALLLKRNAAAAGDVAAEHVKAAAKSYVNKEDKGR